MKLFNFKIIKKLLVISVCAPSQIEQIYIQVDVSVSLFGLRATLEFRHEMSGASIKKPIG